jgi:precorrin-2 dehydrogenase/sirohydrochlorin ferrochelatase
MADAAGGLYPVVLGLRGRRALVVGGGKVAARKAAGLLAADAHVVVVSPTFLPAFGRLVDTAALTLVERPYVPSDLEGMVVVVAATDDRRVNAQVSADARRAGVLVSVVDAPRESDFIVPAVVRRGDLLIAISTSGRSPALAGHLRRELELLVPDDWEVLARLLGAARTKVQKAVGDADRRRDLLKQLVSLDLLSTLRQDGRQAATEQIDTLISAMVATAPAPPQAAPSADETPTP